MNLGETVFPFGNYKGKTLDSVYRTDPTYLLWARENLKPPISEKIAEFIAQKNREICIRDKR